MPPGQAASQRFHETYELERKLGSGSFASVHAARRRRTEGIGHVAGAQPALAVKVVGLFEDRSLTGEVSSRLLVRVRATPPSGEGGCLYVGTGAGAVAQASRQTNGQLDTDRLCVCVPYSFWRRSGACGLPEQARWRRLACVG